MPFIVTVTGPPRPHQDHDCPASMEVVKGRGECLLCDMSAAAHVSEERILFSRRVVLDLDEVKRRLAGRIETLASLTIEQAAALTEQIAALAEHAGLIELPDGRVIELAPIIREQLIDDLGLSTTNVGTTALLVAWNAKYGWPRGGS